MVDDKSGEAEVPRSDFSPSPKERSEVQESLFGRALYALFRVIGLVISLVLCRAKVLGLENIPTEGGVLIASNHRSHADPVILGVMARRPLHFIAKQELFKHFLFGWLIRTVHAFPVRRSGVDREALGHSMQLLKSGRALLVFPEGRRNDSDTFLPEKPGIGLLAVKAGVPIIPAYIHDSAKVLPPGSPILRPHKFYVCFGKPIHCPKIEHEAASSELYSKLSRQVMESISRLRDNLLDTIDARKGPHGGAVSS
ncbi:1-acyl-sn-glycerol-3-phosphate acyltransferase [bacterium]|nr:1-acyl-sn-glycerol-3-phosphate acyltransferase [bacterium]